MKLVKLAALATMTALSFASLGARAQSFNECPSIGYDTNGCEFLVNITGPTTFVVATANPDQGPYDGSDDTLVGVYNSSNATVNSIYLTSGEPIFAFDGDGACTALGAACSDPADPSGYGGPGVTYTVTDAGDGSVNFAGGLAPGASAWFSLEEQLDASDIGPPGPPPVGNSVTPEPSSLVLLGSGVLGLAGVMRRRLLQR